MGYHRCSTYSNSSNAASSTPWAEVLDPFMHKWNPLPSHPQLSKGVHSLVVLDGGKKILVYPSQSSSLFSYDVEDKSWDLIDETFGSSFGEFQTPCVVVDDILYCLSTEVRAYDLAKREWFKKPVKGLKGRDVPSRWYNRDESAAFLVHVGNGRLCLVCSESSISENAIMIVRCTRFRIRKDSDGEEESRLYAIIESLRVYTMDNCNSLTDCLALQEAWFNSLLKEL
ncbi:hypothetical protein L1049_001917 [Liquidambar formosana]|uniref:F-box/kelch-repeat protein n=1 Tax=Liquidambar formosana TaxID=63359 RepID=A0AAP0R686_LIQFO